jgi:hypothetical protein
MAGFSLRSLIPGWSRGGGKDDGVLAPLSKGHKARVTLFGLLWDYYLGQHRENIKRKEGQANDNVTLNWSYKVVNAGVGFLFGKPVTFELDESRERSKAELYLDEVWADDPAGGFVQSVFLKSLAQNGGVCGTAFVRIYPPVASGRPRLVNINPEIVDVITNPDDVTDITAYHLVWPVMREEKKVWKRHRIERGEAKDFWTITAELYGSNGEWAADPSTGSGGVEEWPYDFAPIFHCQNLILANSVWGLSDLKDADLNDAINFVTSNVNRIIRFHAHPRTIGTGFAANQLQTTAVDQFWAIPGENAKVFNLEMGSDLASSRQHKADLEEAFHQVTDIPRLDPSSVNLGALSGFALRILYGPLLTKTADKRGTYGGMLQQINRALLVMRGFPADAPTNVVWQDPLPAAGEERARIAQVLIDSGADREQAYKIAGYTADEAEKLAATRRLTPLDALLPGGNGELDEERPLDGLLEVMNGR